MKRNKAAYGLKGVIERPLQQSGPMETSVQTFQDLTITREELRVSDEELRAQAAALIKAHDQIDAERRHLRDLFELAPDGYLVTDKYGVIKEANHAALQLLNFPVSQSHRMPLPSFVSKADRPAFRKKLAALVKTPLIETLEVRIKPFGLPYLIPVSLRVAAIIDQGPAVVGLRWIMRDMTDQLTMIDALRRSEGLLAQRKRELEAINDLILAVGASLDLHAILDTVSDVMTRQLGIPAGAVLLYEEPGGGAALKTNWGLSVEMEEQLQRVLESQPDQQTDSSRNDALALDRSIQVFLANIKSVVPEWSQCLLIQLWATQNIKGLIYLFSAEPLISDERQAALYRAVGQQVGAAVQNARLYQEAQLRQEQLQFVSKQLVQAQETERRSVARELHDEIGQSLTGLKLLLEANDGQQAETEKAVGMVNELIGQVRNMSLNLRPSMLDDLGVLPTLLWHFRRYTAQTGVKVSFQHSAIDRRFGPEIETAAYRIVQEALTNVARYAGVKEVNVYLHLAEGCLNIHIDDEGRGFDIEAMRNSYHSAGLTGMIERALALGGELHVESELSCGVHISARLPVAHEPLVSQAGS